MIRLPNEVTLNIVCPGYEVIFLAPKALKMEEIQDTINTKIVTRRKTYTVVVLNNMVFSNFASL